MRITHELGKYIGIEDANGVERLRYQYQLEDDPTPSAPKPFCHPIRTPAGVEMTSESPLDHYWHRGVWFTWKFVNGVNYWEERDAVVGRQITLKPPVLKAGPTPDTVRWISDLEWRDNKNGADEARIVERRVLTCRLHDDGAMTLDWHIEQTAQEDLTLDRTVFTTWGGYGGVVARTTQAIHKQVILFDDATETNRPIGEPHRWGAIQGQLDTGRDQFAAFVLMPSPRNVRYPEPFYGTAKPFFNFFGPAPLFHEPLCLKSGETLRHAVRVLILPRLVGATEVEAHWEDWAASEQGKEG
jgi:hypothetical protein